VMPRLVLASLLLAAPLVSCHSLRNAPAPAPGGPAGPGAPLPPATDVVTNFDKKWRPLPSQGYDERSKPKWVEHEDFDTQVGDWMMERPRKQGEVQEGDSTTRACKEHPEHLWCQLWLKDRSASGEGIVHEVRRVVKGGAKDVGGNVAEEISNSANAVSDHAKKSGSNMDKAMDDSGEQAKDAADRIAKGLPKGMSPTENDVEQQQEDVKDAGEQHGHDYPPGMVSPEGGKSPHFHLIGGNMTSLW